MKVVLSPLPLQGPDVKEKATSDLAETLLTAYQAAYDANASAGQQQNGLHTPPQMKTILGLS